MGRYEAVAELERRRRDALGDRPATDLVHLALLKYRSARPLLPLPII